MRRILIGLTFFMFCMSQAFAENPKAVQTKSGLYLIVTGEDGTPAFVKLDIISVDGTIPVTPTNPNEPSPPTEIPEGTFGLTKLAYDAAMELPAVDRAKAKELAKVFSATSKATHGETVKETIGLMNLVLGGEKGAWPTTWWGPVSGRLEELERDGKFRKTSETRAAWSSIADGLGRVK